jgi:hypothetical protein
MTATLKRRLSLLDSPRGVNVALGAWLFVSAFVLPRTFDGSMATWVLGVLVAVASTASFVAGEARYLDRILAVILAIVAVIVPEPGLAAHVNDAILAVAIMALSFVPIGRVDHVIHRHAHHP